MVCPKNVGAVAKGVLVLTPLTDDPLQFRTATYCCSKKTSNKKHRLGFTGKYVIIQGVLILKLV